MYSPGSIVYCLLSDQTHPKSHRSDKLCLFDLRQFKCGRLHCEHADKVSGIYVRRLVYNVAKQIAETFVEF